MMQKAGVPPMIQQRLQSLQKTTPIQRLQQQFLAATLRLLAPSCDPLLKGLRLDVCLCCFTVSSVFLCKLLWRFMNVLVLLCVPSLIPRLPRPQFTQTQPLFAGSYPAAIDDAVTV